MWQHKFQVCNFVATQKLKLNFCVATKKVIDKKFFLCCHNFANQIFVLPQDFDFKSCGSTKSPKFLIFYTLKKEKIRGNSRQFFFWILENSGDFWWFQWFGKIEKHCTVAVKFIFFKSKKNTNIIFFGWNCDRLHSQSAFPSPPCLLKCAPTPAGAELRTMHLQQTKSMCKEAAILSNQFIYAGTHSSVIISSTSCTKVVCLFWKGGPLFS